MLRFISVLAAVCTVDVALAVQATPQSFATDAAAAGMAEVALSRLALQKSSSADVKQFAQMMIKDHSRAGSTLKTIASQDGVRLPTAPTPEQQAVAKELRGKSGGAFDTAYAAQMVKDHQKAVELFKQASDDAQLDKNLRTFAEKTLPTLQHHLQEAQKLNDAVAGIR
jgi:putative membrane protein